MPYLNVDLDYFDHRKTKRLIGLLGRGAEVLPLRLWAYCGKFHAHDGRLTDYSPQEIESLVSWWGKSGIMLTALLKAEFVSKDSTGLFVHGWLEHQGHIVAFKARGKLMAEARWAKARADAASIAASNAQVGGQAMPNQTDPTKPTDRSSNIGFDAVRLANRIISNETGWHYDNCKVEVVKLKTRSLASVIEPYLARGMDDGKILSAWMGAVFKAHGASVDRMAKDATAYCVACFKEEMG